jgi:hypothetical protein
MDEDWIVHGKFVYVPTNQPTNIDQQSNRI